MIRHLEPPPRSKDKDSPPSPHPFIIPFATEKCILVITCKSWAKLAHFPSKSGCSFDVILCSVMYLSVCSISYRLISKKRMHEYKQLLYKISTLTKTQSSGSRYWKIKALQRTIFVFPHTKNQLQKLSEIGIFAFSYQTNVYIYMCRNRLNVAAFSTYNEFQTDPTKIYTKQHFQYIMNFKQSLLKFTPKYRQLRQISGCYDLVANSINHLSLWWTWKTLTSKTIMYSEQILVINKFWSANDQNTFES